MDSKKPIIPFPEFHSEVNSVAKTLYESGHFTDALRKASIRLEEVCSKILKDKTGEELTGVPLMQRLFSIRDPKQKMKNISDIEDTKACEENKIQDQECILPIINISTKKGVEKQKHFCNLYSGFMGAIRNTLAHTTDQLDDTEALYGLNIVSYLFYKLDTAIVFDKFNKIDDEPKTKKAELKTSMKNSYDVLMTVLMKDPDIISISKKTDDKKNAKLVVERRAGDLIAKMLETEKLEEEYFNQFHSDGSLRERIYSDIIKRIYA